MTKRKVKLPKSTRAELERTVPHSRAWAKELLTELYRDVNDREHIKGTFSYMEAEVGDFRIMLRTLMEASLLSIPQKDFEKERPRSQRRTK